MSTINWIIAGVLALYSLWLVYYTYKVAQFYEQIGNVRWVPMFGAAAAIVGFALAFTSIPMALWISMALLLIGLITYIVGGVMRRSAVRRRQV